MLKSRGHSIDPQALATSALAFLASEPDRLGRFLAMSGLEPANIRAAARNPNFLPSVLDYLMADETLLVAFAAAETLSPEAVGEARRALSRDGDRAE